MAEADPLFVEIEEIKALSDRSLAYAALLRLLRRSADDPSAMGALTVAVAVSSPPLLPLLLADVHRPDEETYALKLRQFHCYPAVCNLAVWCVSIQQLQALVIELEAHSLIRAIVHALDNPFGSLSTTFEATQALNLVMCCLIKNSLAIIADSKTPLKAVMKLASQIPEKMRDLLSVWLPPIYRRLLSANNTERSTAERCLLKMSSIILPPPPLLSEVVASNLKKELLLRMTDMLHDNLQNVQVIKAWGWYVSLLGSTGLSDRHLLNKLLKIPEKTFTHADDQVQVASLMIGIIVGPEEMKCMNFETRVVAMNAALKIFKSVLKGKPATLRSGNCSEYCVFSSQQEVEMELKKYPKIAILSVIGEAAIQMITNTKVFGSAPQQSKECDKYSPQCSPIKYSLGLVSRFLELSLVAFKARPQDEHHVTIRVFEALDNFSRLLFLKQDILLLLELISDPLCQWLSSCAKIYCEIQQGGLINQLLNIWSRILDCLTRSQPPILFNSSFLETQASLLQTTLGHPHPPISDVTIEFWRTTYNRKVSLRYPSCLLPTLEKLSRSGRIILQKDSAANDAFSCKQRRGSSRTPAVSNAQKRPLSVIASEFENDHGLVNLYKGFKRKRFKSENGPIKGMKHVERFEDVSGSDCRMDTMSASNNLSERKEPRKPEYIMEMLRRKR
ncbi:hypothetical protein ACMD2_12024 [Ananas comosus]|uniref:Telomere-associated protein Rif1 N-terminal domain-containing protein n=1 Tax=Ananas comosus TaxID=4615 RepID=A0A199UPN5_ANACO|nr:hypothetical protein ACMD2_12024 [Ananas comosus]